MARCCPDESADRGKCTELKILLVSSSFYPKIDGSTRCVYDHARRLAQRGNDVYLVTRGIAGAKQNETFEGIHVRRSSYSFRGGTLLSRIRLMIEQMLMIIMLQRKEHFSVIHVHGFTSGLAAMPCKYMFGVPLIVTTHGTELLWPRKLWWKSSREIKFTLIFEKIVLNHCDVVIAQSKGVKEYMLRIYGKQLEDKIRIIHTGVDQEKFMVPPKEGGSPQVLFVGALSEIKGVSCLLNAFVVAHNEIPELRLVLVGSGPSGPTYKKYVQGLNLNGAIEFRGPVRDDARLLDLYRGSDIVVLPSNVGGPISCTVLEGLSCGKAVISTNVPGGIPDVLADGVGILIQPEDGTRLASEIQRLVTEPDYLRTQESNARRAIEEHYTLDSMIDKLTSLYREVGA
jgi:glycosyltransferase involved in cell wall biosynthesis